MGVKENTMKRNSISDVPRLLEAAFWKHVEPMMDDRGCWEWSGSVSGQMGYASFGVKVGGKRANAYGHRYSWELHVGAVPAGFCVLHRCDNPTCVNPAHLFLGTRLDNTQDMLAKNRGRWRQHARHWRADCPKCGKRHHTATVVKRCVAGLYRVQSHRDDARFHEGIEP